MFLINLYSSVILDSLHKSVMVGNHVTLSKSPPPTLVILSKPLYLNLGTPAILR